MAGFGKIVANALVGAAEGYGNYLIGEGTRRQKAADDQALLDREMALARFRQNLGDESDVKRNKLQKETISHSAQENRLSNTVELKQREVIGIREEGRAEKRQIKAETRAEQRAIRQDDRELNKALRIEAARAAQEGGEIQRWVEDDGSGTVVGITKDGRVWDSGVRFVRKKGGESTYEDVLGGDDKGGAAPVGGTGTPDPLVAPARGFRGGEGRGAGVGGGQQTMTAQEYSRIAADAQRKVQAGEEGWKGLDAAGVRKKLEAIYGRSGYSLPPIG